MYTTSHAFAFSPLYDRNTQSTGGLASLEIFSWYTFGFWLLSRVVNTMEKDGFSRRNEKHYKKRKNADNRVLDRLTYNPAKHKQKMTKELRQKLQQKALPSPKPSKISPKMKFGSFNVNGPSVDASWAIQQLLKDRDFDVRYDE